jgi:hypothetical protein
MTTRCCIMHWGSCSSTCTWSPWRPVVQTACLTPTCNLPDTPAACLNLLLKSQPATVAPRYAAAAAAPCKQRPALTPDQRRICCKLCYLQPCYDWRLCCGLYCHELRHVWGSNVRSDSCCCWWWRHCWVWCVGDVLVSHCTQHGVGSTRCGHRTW